MPTTELWTIYCLAFGAVLLGAQGTYWFFSHLYDRKRATNRRVALSENLTSPVQVLETLRRERGLGLAREIRVLKGFETLLSQTGLRCEPVRLLTAVLGLIALLFVAFTYAFGFGVVLAAMLAIAIGLAGSYLGLLRRRRKRVSRFSEQLPEAVDVIVRGLRAGHPFRVAIGLVAREMPDPLGSEFGILADEILFGLDPNVAVDNLVDRVGAEDLQFLAVAVKIQSRTGGSLAEILSRLAKLMRTRATLRLKVRALTSEGRLSAVFLSLAPFILFGLINFMNPSYFGDIRNHVVTMPAIVLGLMLLAIGNIVMYRMVNFKV